MSESSRVREKNDFVGHLESLVISVERANLHHKLTQMSVNKATSAFAILPLLGAGKNCN